MKKNILGIVFIIMSTAVLLIIANWYNQNKKGVGVTRYDFVMGTSMSQRIYGKNTEDVMNEIYSRLNELENDTLSWRNHESEISKINDAILKNYTEVNAETEINKNNDAKNNNTSSSAGENTIKVSNELGFILEQSLEISKDSKGALDITIHPLLEIWGIENETLTIPDEESISNAINKINYQGVTINKEQDEYELAFNDQVELDLGAVGKGYALDVAADILQEAKVDGAIITVGGSILVYGEKSDKTDWNVAIRNPRGEEGDIIGTLLIDSSYMHNNKMTVSTSGDYEKFIIKDGIRYHHIFNTKTGYPATSGIISVTVICEDGLVSDGLSTACFVLGYEESLPLLKKYNAEAIFIDEEGKVILTDGVKDNFIRK